MEIAGLNKLRVLVSCCRDDNWEEDFSRQVNDEVPQAVMFLKPLGEAIPCVGIG